MGSDGSIRGVLSLVSLVGLDIIKLDEDLL